MLTETEISPLNKEKIVDWIHLRYQDLTDQKSLRSQRQYRDVEGQIREIQNPNLMTRDSMQKLGADYSYSNLAQYDCDITFDSQRRFHYYTNELQLLLQMTVAEIIEKKLGAAFYVQQI